MPTRRALAGAVLSLVAIFVLPSSCGAVDETVLASGIIVDNYDAPAVAVEALEPGAYSVRPYVNFWANALYATQRTNPGPFTLWVYSEADQPESAFSLDVRRTQLGLEVGGPRLPALGDATTGGRLEVDFYGDFVTENRANILLRHAYWEAQNDEFRLLIGQTWDVASPLIPSMLDYGAGYAAGNIGFRRAQLRLERRYWLANGSAFQLQGSLNQDVVTDFPNDAGVRRESSAWPVLQGRLAWSRGDGLSGQPGLTWGISGHLGETQFDFTLPGPPPVNLPPVKNARFPSWSYNFDIRWPITERLGIQGEYFMGQNLGTFLGGIGQGVCACVRLPIDAQGGWGEIWYDWTPVWHSHLGFGVDDPDNRDSLVGRTYNQFFFTNLIWDITPRLSTGIEVGVRKTLYHDERAGLIPPELLMPSAPGNAVTVNWSVMHAF